MAPVEIKANILIDVDGVCADFMGTLFEFLEIEPFKVTRWDVLSADSRLGWDRVKTVIETPEFWSEMKPLTQNIEALTDFFSTNHNVRSVTSDYTYSKSTHTVHFRPVFVTSPWLTFDMQANRLEWLKTHCAEIVGGNVVDNLVFTGNKSLVAGAVIVDDRPENVINYLSRYSRARGIIVGDLDDTDHLYRHSDRFVRIREDALTSSSKPLKLDDKLRDASRDWAYSLQGYKGPVFQ